MESLAWLGVSALLAFRPWLGVWLVLVSVTEPWSLPVVSGQRPATSAPRSVWLRRWRSVAARPVAPMNPQRIGARRFVRSRWISAGCGRLRLRVLALADCSRKKAACHGCEVSTVLAVLTVRGFVFEKTHWRCVPAPWSLGGVSSFNSFGSFSSAGCVFEKNSTSVSASLACT